MATKKQSKKRMSKKEKEAALDRAYAELGNLVTNIFQNYIAKTEEAKNQR
ncbi:MAG: hypothetical protein ACYC69_16485 [Thermodesulfovibrionales bacterium]